MVQLRSRRLKVASEEAATGFLYEQGWTDGLPVVVPTPDRVEAMLAGTRRRPEDLIGLIPPAMGKATVEKMAINAVMAGCLPSYLPVVIAALEAMVAPEFVLARVQATTNPVAPLAVVNGPIRQKLDINCGHNALGQGRQSNATIGRAIRLILSNIGGAIPGVTDMATLGQPAKYTFCLGENEEALPTTWPPLHVEKGLPPRPAR
ncbi:MAG: hypothetical protein HYX92_11975 [Chloroflexi bacterium]|nr:hypothetical protein [Chloroflexota bacterium]